MTPEDTPRMAETTDRQARLQPHEFHRRLVWLMCADQWPEPDTVNGTSPTRERYVADLNAQALLFGFDDWVDAYHRYQPDESELDALLRIAYVPGPDGR